MQNWMQALAAHYERTRATFPEDDLLILFDIDGTILDARHMMLYLLQAYDQHHDTDFFINHRISDINFNADNLEEGLTALAVPEAHFSAIRIWYEKYCWSMAAILESHRPFPGVLSVIRWFQLQPHTHVGLNTSRPESLRGETLCSLNKLGREYRVRFSSDLLYMREATATEEVAAAKVAGVEYFRGNGYRPFAMVDNQPLNLEAVAATDPGNEILLLHAGNVFQQRPEHIPAAAVQGNVYDLTELIPKKALPRHIQFIWQGVSSEAALDQFLASSVRWADLGMLTDAYLNGCRFGEQHAIARRQSQLLHECLEQLRRADRGVKVDLKADQESSFRLITLLQSAGIVGNDIWFHINTEHLSEPLIRHLAETQPGSTIEVSIDFLAPLIKKGGQLAENILNHLSDWGVNRFALSWKTSEVRQLHERLDQWSFETTIYNVRELEAFLQAVLLMPRAICSDFNYAKWQEQWSGKREVHNVDGELLRHA